MYEKQYNIPDVYRAYSIGLRNKVDISIYRIALYTTELKTLSGSTLYFQHSTLVLTFQ